MGKITERIGGFLGSRGFASGTVTALVIAVIIVLNIIIYTLTSIFGLYIYSPMTYDYTLTGAMDELFEERVDDNTVVNVTFCMAREDLAANGVGMFVLKTAEYYAERYPFIKLNFVNLLTKIDDEGNYVDLTKYQTDMRGNETALRTSSVIFSSGEGAEENYRVITDGRTSAGFSDFFSLNSDSKAYAYVGEEIFGSMVAWVLEREHKVAYFTGNHGETIDIAFASLLSSAGYYIDTVNLRENEVPEDAAMLVISNPTADFERGSGIRAEIERIESYLENGNGGSGGRLYVAIDPLADAMPTLEDFLSERCGITVSGGEGEYGYTRDIVYDSTRSIALDSSAFIVDYGQGGLSADIQSSYKDIKSGGVLIADVARLTLDESAEALLVSSEGAVSMRGGKTVSDEGSFVLAAYSKLEYDNSEAGVFVIPSALLTNADLLVYNGYSNKEFVYSLLDQCFDASFSVYGTRSIVYDSGVVENLTQQMSGIYTACLLLVPTALLCVGVFITVRRKNR